jgi:competence protein ComEC
MKRPLLPVALLYVGGILLGVLLPLAVSVLLAAAGMAALLAIACRRLRLLSICVLTILAGWGNYCRHTAIISPNDLRRLLGTDPQIVRIRGELIETPSVRLYSQDHEPAWRTLAKVEVRALQPNKRSWRHAVGTIAVSTPAPLTNLFAGQTIEVSGVAALPRHAVAEGTFDYRAYLSQLGIYYHLQTGSEQDWQILHSPRRPPLADRFRAWGQRALALGLPCEDESLRLQWALTLGWKPALTEEVSEPFVRAATYHIFAVDGLRMAIIFGIFFGLFRALGLPRAVSGAILVPLIWFYVALTGWPASAIRATVMLTIVIVGWSLERPSDLINSLFAAALIILLWEPQQLFQAGFQLSFFVVLCIILMMPPLHAWLQRQLAPDAYLPKKLHRRWPVVVALPARYFGDTLLTSFAAWIGSIPLVACYFNIVTPVSTPANLLAVPLCVFVLISNISSLVLAGWFPAGAELFNHAGWFLMECIRVSSEWFARWPAAYYYVVAPSWSTTLLYYALLLALLTGWLFQSRWRRGRILLCGAAILLWCVPAWKHRNISRITVLPVNGGLSVFADTTRPRQRLLVDCGTTNSVQFVVKPFLRAQGVNSLPALALTHGDLRHIGGAESIADLFSVRKVYASPVRFRSATYRRTVANLETRRDLLGRAKCEDQLGAWTVLHPGPADRFGQADDNAMVLSGTFFGTRLLLLSDLGRNGQRTLLERTLGLRADIVVAGLPAQGEPLRDDLLDAIRPHLVIIGDSEFPASERASAPLRERLGQKKIPVIYTRSAGAVTLEFLPNGWRVRTTQGITLSSHGISERQPKQTTTTAAQESPADDPENSVAE